MKKQLHIFIIGFLLISSYLDAQVVYGPQLEPPLGVFREMSGTEGDNLIGTASGKDFTFSAIDLLNQTEVFFGTILDSVKLSLDGGDFASGDTVVQEIMQFDPALSDLQGGILTWVGTTRLPESATTPVYTRFHMIFTANAAPLALVDPATVGLDPYLGGLPQLTPGISFNVNLRYLASYNETTGYIPHIPFYDQNSLSDGQAYSSVGWGWYWNNSNPALKENNAIPVNENDTVTVTEQFLMASDIESDSSMVTFRIMEAPEALPLHGTLFRNGTALTAGDMFTKGDVMTDSITYAHDGSETVKDSVGLRLYDGDMGYYSMNDDSTFYVVFTITPVDDLPVVEVNDVFDVDEDAETTLSETALLTTDSESTSDNVTYTIDPDNENVWPKFGLLKKSGVPMNSGGQFTQADLEAGIISYKHDGVGSVTDGFIFTVVDEFGHPAEKQDGTTKFFFEINVVEVNDNPVFTVNQTSTMTAWEVLTIDVTHLAASDEESDDSNIFFTLEDSFVQPANGQLSVDGNVLGLGGSFTMQDILDGVVKYMHNSQPVPESDQMVFTITDGDGGMASDQGFTLFQHNITITLTGQESFNTENVSVYPNPGSGQFRVKGLGGADRYEVYNIVGELVMESNIDQDIELTLDLTSQPEGIYLLQLKEANQVLTSHRIAITR